MIKDIIKDKLRDKEWTFGEIANVTETVEELAGYTYDKMTPKEKLILVWDEPLISPGTGLAKDQEFGAYFFDKCMQELRRKIAIIIKEELSDATVVFKEDNKNEVSERSVGGESHKERTTNEEKDSVQPS